MEKEARAQNQDTVMGLRTAGCADAPVQAMAVEPPDATDAVAGTMIRDPPARAGTYAAARAAAEAGKTAAAAEVGERDDAGRSLASGLPTHSGAETV